MPSKLKCIPERPYHYIIAIAIYPATSKNIGKMYLKYRPICFTNDDIEKMQLAYMLSKDKLFKSSSSEALNCFGCSELAQSITAIKLGASVNQCTLHHISSETPIEEETFDMIVKIAHTSDHIKQLLKEAIIRR